MIEDSFFYFYLIVINLLGGIIFAYDKFAAITKRKRIRESVLHLFEGLGSAFANLLLMYVLRHKTNKSSFYRWTWIFMMLWVFIILLTILY